MANPCEMTYKKTQGDKTNKVLLIIYFCYMVNSIKCDNLHLTFGLLRLWHSTLYCSLIIIRIIIDIIIKL